MPVGLPVSDAGLGGLSSRTGLDGVGAVSVGEWGKQTERGRDTRDVSWCGVMLEDVQSFMHRSGDGGQGPESAIFI